MSECGPIDAMWEAARQLEERGCPERTTLVLAALNGPDDVEAAVWSHLAGEPCALCSAELAAIWARRHPPADVLALAVEASETSALAAALERLSGPSPEIELPPRPITPDWGGLGPAPA